MDKELFIAHTLNKTGSAALHSLDLYRSKTFEFVEASLRN